MNHFFAYINRMRFIQRWALMRNSYTGEHPGAQPPGGGAGPRAGGASATSASAVRWTPAPWPWRRCTTTPARSSPAICPPPSSTTIPVSARPTRPWSRWRRTSSSPCCRRSCGPPMRTPCRPADPEMRAAGQGGGQALRPHQVHGGAEGRQHRVPAGRRPDRRPPWTPWPCRSCDYFCEHFLPSYSLTLDELE